MKKKKSPVVIVLILALLVAAAGVVTYVVTRFTETREVMDSREYFGVSSDDEVALIVDDHVSEVPAKMIEGRIYLPYETAANDINGSIFISRDASTLIVTTPTDKLTTPVTETGTDVRIVDGSSYVSLDL